MSDKILLVEDEAIIAMSEARMLEKHGYDVVTASNGQSAVEAVDSDPEISLILMDIDLGTGMDGTEAAETILERHDLPIAFLSSHTEPEVVEKTEGITSYGYIVKNSGETVLLASIRMAFRLYEAHLRLKEQKEQLRTTVVQVEQTEEVLREREEMYRNLMENSIDAVQLLDEEGRFLDVNDRGCEMIGYSREELLSMRIADIDPNYPADGFSRFWQKQPKGTSVLFETTHIDKDGTRIPVEVNGIFFEVDKKKYLFGVARDITERKHAEEALRHEREFLATVLDTIDDAIIICDAAGRIVRFNEAARRLHGLPEQPIRSDQWADHYDLYRIDGSTPLPTDEIPLFRAFEGEHVRNAEIAVAPKGRRSRLLRCNGNQLKDKSGNRTGAVVVMHDVTDYLQVKEELRAALESKDSLMRELNHRVKNNLNMLSSLLSLKDAETEEDLSDITHRIAAIGLVHEKLHQYDEVQLISVREYLQELIEALFSSLTSQHVEIANNIEDVHTDPDTVIPLGLIVNEVATNAIKYGFRSDGEARFTVTLTRSQEQEGHTLTLSNTGNPFPDDVGLDHAGTLGLQLITGLATQLGGTIDLRKRPYPVFTIQIPGGLSREE